MSRVIVGQASSLYQRCDSREGLTCLRIVFAGVTVYGEQKLWRL